MPDIAMHLLDIVYNSIRAFASLITIRIYDSEKENTIEISVEDNGCGMDEETIEKVMDPFFTTRTTRKVGLGVPLFKEGLLATGGSFDIHSKINVGTTIKGNYIKNHWDTPPLGDLPETLVTLIQANEKIDYLFTYTTDSHQFCLDTKEIKDILDGVKINEPEIILWLKDYIKEGLSQ